MSPDIQSQFIALKELNFTLNILQTCTWIIVKMRFQLFHTLDEYFSEKHDKVTFPVYQIF